MKNAVEESSFYLDIFLRVDRQKANFLQSHFLVKIVIKVSDRVKLSWKIDAEDLDSMFWPLRRSLLSSFTTIAALFNFSSDL